MKTILSLIFALVFLISNAQVNNYEGHKCGHTHSLETKSINAINPLMNNYDVKYMKLNLSVTNTTTYVSGNVDFKAKVINNPIDTFVFELKNSLTIDSVIVGGQSITYNRTGDLVFVYLQSVIALGNYINAEVYYHGNSTGGGMSEGTSGSWGNQAMWTLSESFHAKDWFPVKQDLRDKIDSVDLAITVPDHLMVGSNGLLISVDTIAGGFLRYNWKSRYAIDYYLISLAVAEYIDYSIYAHPQGASDSLLIQNYVYNNPQCLPNFKTEIDGTINMIELFSDKYSMYPFMNEKYGHAMAPFGGGMEHQTMTTLGWFDFGLIAHELGHMWFGDNVTCATWQDIWINEGFASYTEYLAEEFIHTQLDADNWMQNAHSVAKGSPNGSIYIPFADATNESRIFSHQLSYKKGAAIIHMIRFEMQNDSLFFATLKEFQAQFKDSTASGDDFRNVATAVSGIDFTEFFDQWYYGEGYPSFNINYQINNDTLYFTSNQTVSYSTPLFAMLMEYKLSYLGGDTTIKVYQNTNSDSYSLYFPHQLIDIEVDPNNWVLDGYSTVVNINEEELDKIDFEVYPNPSSRFVQIKCKILKVESCSVLDIYGKTIQEFKVQNSEFRINIEDLAKGIYIVKLKTDKGTKVKKFIKE